MTKENDLKYALLLMGRTQDPDCGEDGGADPEEFMEFDQEISEDDCGRLLADGHGEEPRHRSHPLR